MDEMLEDEELMFNNEVISKLANESISNVIGEKMFTEKDSKIWMNKVNESILTNLQTLNKPFKLNYIICYQYKNISKYFI